MVNGALGIAYHGDTNDNKTTRPYRTVMMWNGSGGTLAAGDVVAVDRSVTTKGLGKAMKQAAIASEEEDVSAFGATLRAVPNLTWGEVQVLGVQEDVNMADAVEDGELVTAGVTAGRLTRAPDDQDATTTQFITLGRALVGGSASNRGTVEWFGAAGF
jgi:hypothetical protein